MAGSWAIVPLMPTEDVSRPRSFHTPIVLSTNGGMGKEATTFYKQLADTIAQKRHHYSMVMGWLSCQNLLLHRIFSNVYTWQHADHLSIAQSTALTFHLLPRGMSSLLLTVWTHLNLFVVTCTFSGFKSFLSHFYFCFLTYMQLYTAYIMSSLLYLA